MKNLKTFLCCVQAVAVVVLVVTVARPGVNRPEPTTRTARPAGARERDETAMTVVFPPPVIRGGSARINAAVELLCDRLGERLGESPGVSVVDRAQLDRVLAERTIATQPTGPALSYDAMVRIKVDLVRLVPHLRLTVIDLSRGNVMSEKAWNWPVVPAGDGNATSQPGGTAPSSQPAAAPQFGEAQVAEMVNLCLKGLKSATTKSGDEIRVRVLNPVITDRAVRLEPLGMQIKSAFEDSLRRRPRISLVQHLEAATAKEESLLLLMGLTRLPGGRQFAPQADATVEFRLKEVDSLGKDFRNTSINLEYRLERGSPGEWSGIKGTVAEWDKLIATVWESVARDLVGKDARRGRNVLDELELRRRQAQGELEKLRQLRAGEFPTVYNVSTDSAGVECIGKIAHIASIAAKLDPLNEEAAYLDVKFNYILRRHEVEQERHRAREILLPTARDARRFLAGFEGNARRRDDVAMTACECVHRMLSPNYCPGTADVATLEVLAELAELAVPTPSRGFLGWSWEDGIGVNLIYQHMTAAGMDVERCRQWRWRCLDMLDKKLDSSRSRSEVMQVMHFKYEMCFLSLRSIQITAAAALDDGDKDKARKLMDEVRSKLPTMRWASGETVHRLEQAARRLGGAALAHKIRQWSNRNRGTGNMVSPLRVKWPTHSLETDFPNLTLEGIPIPKTLKDHSDAKDIRLLGIFENRMYLLFRAKGARPGTQPKDRPPGPDRRGFGYVSVDQAGKPTGDHIVELDPPELPKNGSPDAAGIFFGRVCLGFYPSGPKGGLLVYDTRSARWTLYEPDHGLPDRSVGLIFPLDDNTILCGTDKYGAGATGGQMYTVHLPSKKVTLLSRLSVGFEPPQAVWKSGQKWIALQRNGIAEDILSSDPPVRPMPANTPQGWVRKEVLRGQGVARSIGTPVRAAWVGERIFASYWDTLREFDRSGKIVREWPLRYLADIGWHYALSCHAKYSRMSVPGEVPVRTLLGSDGKHLYLAGARGLVLYDPAKDQWYGPVAVKGFTDHERRAWKRGGMVTGGGVWFPITGAVWLGKSKILNACRRSGLVFTSGQLKRRMEDAIRAMPLLDRAKIAFSRHQFDQAKDMLEKVLADQPTNVEALVVMGLLHEPHGLNQPDKALPYYQKVQQVGSEGPEQLAGMILQFQWYKKNGQFDKAIPLGKEMIARYKLELNYLFYLTSVMSKMKTASTTRPVGAAGE